jgi:hypothetical protein
MRTQLHDCKVLVYHIIDKVQEYIDEIDCWQDEPKLWVDAESDTVVLDEKGKEYVGESKQVSEFIRRDDAGKMEPDVDAIEDFASGWFDFRQA